MRFTSSAGDTIKNNLMREKVRAYIERHGSSQSFIAKQVGLNSSTISRWLAEQNNLSDENIRLLENFISS